MGTLWQNFMWMKMSLWGINLQTLLWRTITSLSQLSKLWISILKHFWKGGKRNMMLPSTSELMWPFFKSYYLKKIQLTIFRYEMSYFQLLKQKYSSIQGKTKQKTRASYKYINTQIILIKNNSMYLLSYYLKIQHIKLFT